jgi:hypothetical protein
MGENGCVPRDSRRNSDDDVTTTSADAPREDVVTPRQNGADLEPVETPGDVPIGGEAAVESEHRVRVRRTPRYGRFMILGGAFFAVGAFIATYSFPQGTGYDRNTVFGFVLLASVAVGVGLGALAAIIASAATKRTERTVLADRIDVRAADAPAESSDLPDLGELPAEAEHGEPGEDGGEQARPTE